MNEQWTAEGPPDAGGLRLRPVVTALGRWRGRLLTFARHPSADRQVLAATAIVGVATLGLKVAAMVKDAVVAYHFGTTDPMDAFLIALLLPTFAINVVAGSLPAALVPVYVRVRESQGPDAASRLLSTTMLAVVVLLSGAVAVLMVASPLVLRVLGATFGGDKLAMTQQLFLVLLPMVVIAGISGVCTAILNANGRFLLGATTPLLLPAIIVLTLVAAGRTLGVYALAAGTALGYTAETALLVWMLRRSGLLRAHWHGWSPETREVARQYVPMLVGTAVMSSSPLVDQSMAAMLGPGSVAQFAYGTKLVTAGIGIAVTAVSTAVFPHFSKLVASGDWGAVRRTLVTYSRLILLATIPVVIVVICFSEITISAFFERGKFSAADVHAAGRVQALFALQIPFYVAGILGVRLLSATGANRVLMWISVWNFVVNIVANYAFMRFLGVAGIALSTSMVYVLSCTIIYVAVFRRIRAERARSVPIAA